MSHNKFIKSLAFFTSILCTTVVATSANAGSWRSEATIGGKLKTHVYVPTSSPRLNNKRALMVSLHGCGQTHSDFKTGANWRSTADAYGMVVALPKSSNEGSYGWLGCWNFHVGMSASRNRTDAKYLINMVNALLSDTSLNLDPKQVYITGLSSGAGMTNQMACLAPDIFAGAGVNAGPAPGSRGSDLRRPGISATKGRSNCNSLAGSRKNKLYTQVYNNVHGTRDTSVGPAHAQRNTEIFDLVYEQDGSNISVCSTSTLSGGGDVTTLCDGIGPRISKVMVNGMKHAWPAGRGSSGGGRYIDHTHINYPEYITSFFFDNNRRL
ncbi:MAG: PHB depolymerase family esterase [Agarilytica sp.]